jgi:hypothetical protein
LNIIDKIVSQVPRPKPAVKKVGPADQQHIDLQAAIAKYKIDKAAEQQRNAVEARAAAKDKATADAARAEFLRTNPNADGLEKEVFDAHQAVWLAKRVVDRNPDKVTRIMGDGSRALHPNLTKLRAAEARLATVVANYRRVQDALAVPMSSLNPVGADINAAYFNGGKK